MRAQMTARASGAARKTDLAAPGSDSLKAPVRGPFAFRVSGSARRNNRSAQMIFQTVLRPIRDIHPRL